MPKMTKETLTSDLIAGITGTIISIPQSVAFAMIAGLPPVYGFYASMIAPPIAALFGSSNQMISGPTTAISIMSFAAIKNFADPTSQLDDFVMLSILMAFMVGVIQLVMGFAKMGKLVNFVSHSVVIGFTAGAGILIAFKQLKHVFGIHVPQGTPLIGIVKYIATHISEANWYVFAVAMGTLISAILIRLVLPKFYMLLAMIIGSLIAIFIGAEAHGIETVGEIKKALPPFEVPNITWENMRKLAPSALAIAILGLVEAVAIARAIALRTRQTIDSNQEFIGQGLANLVVSFFKGYVGSGSFTRSGVNQQAGAKTPMAAVFAATFLVIVLVFFKSYAAYLPKPAMGGIILLVGYNLIDFHHIKQVIRSSKRELIVLAVTALGTMFIPRLEFAILLGVLTSFVFYLERTSSPHIATMAVAPTGNFVNIKRDTSLAECPQLKIIRIDGSMYYGSVESVAEYFADLGKTEYKHVLIICRGINFIDLAAAEWLSYEAEKWKEKGGGLYFANLKLVAQDVLRKGGFYDKIGPEYFFTDKREAISSIFKRLDKDICASCEVRVFKECQSI
ncbi:MAG TPA: SulP family inorganic anion transporter [Saprospiraceae bacterium]|nr:SulP family inorganic anion transporter [Saprospiraceae bacterium]